MIASFSDKALKRLYERGDRSGIRPDMVAKVERILQRLDEITAADQMALPGYRLHALSGDLKGFWSVTAYGESDFLIENPIDRYCVNDRSGLHRNPDGSIDITLSKEAPADTTNWLPVGEGDFHLFLRIYKPDAAALTDWQPPVVRTN